MTNPQLIAVRHVVAGQRRIPILLTRNENGSIAGRCVLGPDDTPIVDGPTLDAVVAMFQGEIEGLLLARQLRTGG